MDNLVKRLRDTALNGLASESDAWEAADEIERLNRLVEEAAQIADGFRCGACGMDGKAGAAIRARAAANSTNNGGGET